MAPIMLQSTVAFEDWSQILDEVGILALVMHRSLRNGIIAA